jgi:hypothetical protein
MKFVSRLALAAGACMLCSLPALADDPPGDVKLFHFAENDGLVAYVDFNSLDRASGTVGGWTYNVFDPARSFSDVDASVGSYWERFSGNCRKKIVLSYGLVLLDEQENELTRIGFDEDPATRKASSGSFEEALLGKICGGKAPPESESFTSTKQAEDTVRTGNALMDIFGLGGSDDSSD